MSAQTKNIPRSWSIACYTCGQLIEGPAMVYVPTPFARSLGDFSKAYHPTCFLKDERAAEVELYGVVHE